jgi:hypothetical protein
MPQREVHRFDDRMLRLWKTSLHFLQERYQKQEGEYVVVDGFSINGTSIQIKRVQMQ